MKTTAPWCGRLKKHDLSILRGSALFVEVKQEYAPHDMR